MAVWQSRTTVGEVITSPLLHRFMPNFCCAQGIPLPHKPVAPSPARLARLPALRPLRHSRPSLVILAEARIQAGLSARHVRIRLPAITHFLAPTNTSKIYPWPHQAKPHPPPSRHCAPLSSLRAQRSNLAARGSRTLHYENLPPLTTFGFVSPYLQKSG